MECSCPAFRDLNACLHVAYMRWRLDNNAWLPSDAPLSSTGVAALHDRPLGSRNTRWWWVAGQLVSTHESIRGEVEGIKCASAGSGECGARDCQHLQRLRQHLRGDVADAGEQE